MCPALMRNVAVDTSSLREYALYTIMLKGFETLEQLEKPLVALKPNWTTFHKAVRVWTFN